MSTYTTSLGLEEITPGDQAGLWGNTTNNNLELIDQAVTGVTPLSFTGLSGTVRVLDSANGAIDEARAAVLNITGTATGPNTVVVPNRQKTYLVRNNTGQGVIFRTASPSATYTVDAGNSILVFCDGNNNVFTGIASPSVGTLSVSAGGTGQTTFGGGGFVKSSGGTNALTVSSAVSLTADVSGTLPVTSGGTGLNTIPAGAILRGAGTSAPAAVTGTPGQVLTWNNSQWEPATPATGAVTSILAGTGISVNSPTGAVTVTNTGPTLGSTNTWTGAYKFNGGAAVLGVTNGSSAAAGYVGELLQASSPSPVALTNGVNLTIATLTLTAGDWNVWGWVTTSSNVFTSCLFSVNTTNTLGQSSAQYISGGGTIGPVAGQAPMIPQNSSSPSTIFLVMNAAFPSGSPTASGVIYARRVR
jgi:hypothetical protein